MNEKVLHTLEYNKILDQLTEYAFSADAKSRCQKLRPITDRAQIEQLQQQTSDAAEVSSLTVAVCVAIPLLIISFLVVDLSIRRSRKKQKK